MNFLLSGLKVRSDAVDEVRVNLKEQLDDDIMRGRDVIGEGRKKGPHVLIGRQGMRRQSHHLDGDES